MTLNELEQLPNGALIHVEGKGWRGHTDMLILFDRSKLRKGKEPCYLFGNNIIPLEWIKLATKSDYNKRINQIKQEYEGKLSTLEEAFKKVKIYKEENK